MGPLETKGMRLPVKLLCVSLMAVTLFLSGTGCKKKSVHNRVDLKQIQVDNTNDYRFIFRETLMEEEKRKAKERERDFR